MFEQFLKEKKYLDNISPKTEDNYRYAYKKFAGFQLNKKSLAEFVIAMRDEGLSPGGCNVYIRAINSYLSWCYASGLTSEHLRIKQLKVQHTVGGILSDNEVSRLINYRPKTDQRIHTLVLVLLDTGIRIEEALTLRRERLDFDNLLLTVLGKGNKERIIPFSVELRKVLYKFSHGEDSGLVFGNRHGGRLSYNNVRRDFVKLMDKLGIKVDGSFHAFRRYYATHFIRQNGNPLILQRLLGHSSLSTTQMYINLVTADLTEAHERTSVLARYR